MIQNWRKLGLIHLPVIQKSETHFSVPFAMPLSNNVYQLYYSSRDEHNRSLVRCTTVDIITKEVLNVFPTPVLESGPTGAFDDSGVVLFQIIDVKNKKYLFYSGWMLGVTVPFYFWIGLAIADNDGNFIKHSKAPVLPCHDFDPYLTGAPYILYESPVWKMWYISGTKWTNVNTVPKHYYTLKYAESKDGINWERSTHICLPYKNESEYAIARPCVIKENGIYKMWFSYRAGELTDTYRIGYAESSDGLEWRRLDELINLDVSENGWDQEMICYGHVFDHNGCRYMLYNGNGYGKSGIGLAILENKY